MICEARGLAHAGAVGFEIVLTLYKLPALGRFS